MRQINPSQQQLQEALDGIDMYEQGEFDVQESWLVIRLYEPPRVIRVPLDLGRALITTWDPAVDEDIDLTAGEPQEGDDEGDGPAVRSVWGATCIAALTDALPDHLEVIQEYVLEAEHQDGYGYWDQFSTTPEVVDDFNLYMENRADATY